MCIYRSIKRSISLLKKNNHVRVCGELNLLARSFALLATCGRVAALLTVARLRTGRPVAVLCCVTTNNKFRHFHHIEHKKIKNCRRYITDPLSPSLVLLSPTCTRIDGDGDDAQRPLETTRPRRRYAMSFAPRCPTSSASTTYRGMLSRTPLTRPLSL